MTASKRIEATVSTKGQIIIPAELREELGLQPGSKVVFQRVGTKLELEPLTQIRTREKEAFLAELAAIGAKIAAEWDSPLSAVQAVEEQRR
jgi:AbrB family looped-hinge helix DNA binding protein